MDINKYLEMTDEELLSLPQEEKVCFIKELLELMNKYIKEDDYSSKNKISINKFITYFSKSNKLHLSESEIEENNKIYLTVLKIAKGYIVSKTSRKVK